VAGDQRQERQKELELFKSWMSGETGIECLSRLQDIFLNQRSQINNAMWQQNAMASSYIVGQESVIKWLIAQRDCNMQEELARYDDNGEIRNDIDL